LGRSGVRTFVLTIVGAHTAMTVIAHSTSADPGQGLVLDRPFPVARNPLVSRADVRIDRGCWPVDRHAPTDQPHRLDCPGRGDRLLVRSVRPTSSVRKCAGTANACASTWRKTLSRWVTPVRGDASCSTLQQPAGDELAFTDG